MINLQQTGRNQCPCKNCPEHRQPCSDHCQKPEYLAWKDENEKINKRHREHIGSIWGRQEPHSRRGGNK